MPNAKADMKDACGIMKTLTNKNDPYYLNMRLYVLDGINKLETLLDSLPEVKAIEEAGFVELKKKLWVPLYDLLFEPIDGTKMTFFGYILWRGLARQVLPNWHQNRKKMVIGQKSLGCEPRFNLVQLG
mgnify:CR=1 FL=1